MVSEKKNHRNKMMGASDGSVSNIKDVKPVYFDKIRRHAL